MVLYLSLMKKLIGQVMKFIKHIFQTLVPATAIALTGCSNGGYVLGGEYLDSHMHTVIIDTCTVKMTTVSIDSVATTNKKRGFTGNCYSKYFGKISSQFICIVTGKQIGRASCRERVYVLV